MIVVGQRLADVLDTLHDRVIGNRNSPPDRSDQFFLGNEPARVLDQIP